jgi:hypothetical protein
MRAADREERRHMKEFDWLYTGTSAAGLAFGTSLFATGHYLT